MYNRLDIYSMKCFARLRNKAQMFSSLADDHYHTRLMHSLEVESIALRIANILITKYQKSRKVASINFDRLSQIALLHDIGHTPYGHVGERVLNDICTGKTKIEFLPDFLINNCKCGFKHNINSGILFKEYLIKKNKKIDLNDCYILDGITKHSKLYHNHQKRSDYGFEYINSGLPININFKRSMPITIEGFIVAFADEIAQMFSDYIDLFAGGFDVSSINMLLPFSHSSNTKDAYEIASMAVNFMIDLFVKAFNPKAINYSRIKKSNFGTELQNFDSTRRNIIKSNETISSHDFIKERNIIVLFRHYFIHPSDGYDLFEDFQNRIKRHKMPLNIKNQILELDKDNIDNYIASLIRSISAVSKKKFRNYSLVLKIFIKSVAIYISKMTDSYADHKVRKIISTKRID